MLLENHPNFIKIYFGIIVMLFFIAAGIFSKMIFAEDNVLLKDVKIAGKSTIVSTKGLEQKEIPILELASKKEENEHEESIEEISGENIALQQNLDESINLERDLTAENIENCEVEEIQQDGGANVVTDEKLDVEDVQEKEKSIQSVYEGFETVGKIEIPATNVDLPILNNVTVKGMEKAPCLLYETGELNKSGNNLIVGHNYRNDTLFSNNGKLTVGDNIYITTLDGLKLEYIIYDKFITSPEETDYLKREIGEKPEITLSCCNDDDVTRIVLLAKAK